VTATPRAVELVETAALAAADKLADGIIAYDVSDQLVITDAFLLCSAPNDRQVKAIVDEIELRMRQAGASLVRREGEREGRWVLLDYLDVVIHVQHSEERTYYALERIWKDCPQIPLPELVGAGRVVSGGRPPQTPPRTGELPASLYPPGTPPAPTDGRTR
jgi:ribosome-associated protein